jgi:O-antigen ligase
MLILAGAIAALFSAVPRAGTIAVAQEVFLLAWCVAVVNVCRTPKSMQAVLRAWCVSSVAWAAALVGAALTGQTALAGMERAEGGRAAQLFDHPNMAGNYFMISILVVSVARYPRRPLPRAACYLVLGMAMVYAGSNTAFLALPVAALLAITINVRRRSGSVTAAATAICIVVGAAGVWSVAAEPVTSAVQQSENPLVHYSVARSTRSAESRQALFLAQYHLFRSGDLMGIGPAATRHALTEDVDSADKEAHNDYLATLVERGPLGVLALLLLVGAIAVRAARVSVRGLSPEFARAVPNPAAMAGIFLAFAVTALTHEVLHYRHMWALLGILAALYLFGRPAPVPRTAGADTEQASTGPRLAAAEARGA